jgi:hypothetical protein
MVRPNITNATTFSRRPCSVCGNTDWKKVEEVSSINTPMNRSCTVFICNHCGVRVDIYESDKKKVLLKNG